MNRQEFIKILNDSLSSMPADERENAVNYYEEFLNEAEDDEAAISKLGDPKSIAQQIIRESGTSGEAPKQTGNVGEVMKEKMKDPMNLTLLILVVIFSAPLWMGLLGAAFGIVVAAIAVCCSLVFATGAVGIACAAAGLYMLTVAAPVGLILIGVGLVSLSLMTLLFIPLCKLCWKGIVTAVKAISELFSKLFNRQGATV